jgi:UDP-N-acetylglucosamine:LPS N-acetylglucosamine transferase
MLLSALSSPADLARRAAAAHALGKPDAARHLADLVERFGGT